jgi:hypothetical protein
MNGIYHEIDRVLWYDRALEDDVLNKRLRVDIGTLNPEFVNNALRGVSSVEHNTCCINGYLKYLSMGDDPNVNIYVKYGNPDWCYYQGDGITINGWYDLVFQLPPLPPGTWEVRVGLNIYPNQGIAQETYRIYSDIRALQI